MTGKPDEVVIRNKNSPARIILPALISLGVVLSARAMTITVTYDASVTNIGSLAQVQTAFGAAAQTIQNLYTNPVTINITVYSANAGTFGDINLGESHTAFVGSSHFKYRQLTNALRLARTTVADSNSVTSLPANDPTGGTNMWWVPTAEAKALGVLGISAVDPTTDGEIGFATNVSYAFDPNNRAVANNDPNNRAVANKFDFIGVAEHEITEIMGRTTFGLTSTNFCPYDLFRFTNNGARSLDPNANNAYFSVDNGATSLKYFNAHTNGGDIQDWAESMPADSFDAFVFDGEELTLSAADLTAMDILGYNLNYQPPRLIGTTLGDGTFQLNFTNTPGTSYTILATTNISLSVSNWTVLGTTTETLAGQFQFTDTQATNSQLRFYRVRLN